MTMNSKCMRVLIVDDSIIDQKIASKFLKEKEILFDIACNGEQALEYVQLAADKNSQYTHILMDLKMPVMGGLECSQILITKYKEPSFKIIVVTACPYYEIQSDCFKIGIHGIITKPLRKKYLERALFMSSVNWQLEFG
jgi:CheY-like chemotaxis protein